MIEPFWTYVNKQPKTLYEPPTCPENGELVYLGSYNGKKSYTEDEAYVYDLWFINAVKNNEAYKVVLSKSKYFCSSVSFYTEDLATCYDGLKEAIDRAYNKGLDLL